jgi:hypothetical protein
MYFLWSNPSLLHHELAHINCLSESLLSKRESKDQVIDRKADGEIV